MQSKISSDARKLCSDWVEWLKKEKRCALNTLLAYESDVLNFLEFFSMKDVYVLVHEIGFDDFRRWLGERISIKNVSHRSNSRAMSALRSFFKYLSLNGIAKNEKVFFVHKSKQGRSLPASLSESQISLISKSSVYSKCSWLLARDRFLLGLLYGSGLRISEALAVTLDCISGDTIKVIGKGGKERLVLILPIVTKFLGEYINKCPYVNQGNVSRSLFYTVTGKILTRNLFAMHIQKIRNELGLPEHTTPHAFRHSFATHLFCNGVDIRSIQEALGHASLSSTQVYTHLDTTNMIKMHKMFHPNINITEDVDKSD